MIDRLCYVDIHENIIIYTNTESEEDSQYQKKLPQNLRILPICDVA